MESKVLNSKTLHNTDADGAYKNVPDIQVFGDPDAWRLVCKASSKDEGWMRSTKILALEGGCLVQVSTHQRGHDGSNAVAEAIAFVSGAHPGHFGLGE